MTSLLAQLDSVMVPRVARQTLSDWIAGKISAPIALLALLNIFQQPEALRAALEPLLAHIRTVGDPHQRDRTAEMNRLLQRLPSALTNISELLEIERNHQRSGSGDPIARCAALFDQLVKKSEGASVALYSFGDAALLQSVTNEVLALLADWNFLGDDRVILQNGCGIGRFEAPLPGQSTAQLKKLSGAIPQILPAASRSLRSTRQSKARTIPPRCGTVRNRE